MRSYSFINQQDESKCVSQLSRTKVAFLEQVIERIPMEVGKRILGSVVLVW